jgi:putative redox protein
LTTDYDQLVRIRSAELRHEGDHRFSARTGTGRTILFGDDVPTNEYSPVESVVVSLGACSAMDVIGILEKKRQVIDSYTIEVRAEQRDEYPQILSRADVLHIVEGTVVLEKAVRRAIELSATKYCPVNAMLSAGATAVHHRYRILRTGQPPEEGLALVTGPYLRPDVLPAVEALDAGDDAGQR